MFDPKRSLVIRLLLSTGLALSVASAAERPVTPTAITLPEISNGPVSQFSSSQVAFVQSWIRQQAPECPLELSAAVAQGFLEELSLIQP